MKKLSKIIFVYEDGSRDSIEDDRAVLLFQSRINTSGILSGFYDFIISEVPIIKEEETKNDE